MGRNKLSEEDKQVRKEAKVFFNNIGITDLRHFEVDPDFENFDNLLFKINPDISYLRYKVLKKSVEKNFYITEPGWGSPGVKKETYFLNLYNFHSKLKEMGIIE